MNEVSNTKLEHVQIFIDGGNFYHLVLKRLGYHDNDFDFERFAQFLISDRYLTENGKRYYIGTVREIKDNHETTKAMTGQTTLFGVLESNNWCIKTSKLRTRIDTIQIDDRVLNFENILRKGITSITYQKSREKGIDVKLATDLLVGAYENKYDTVIIVSSDTDLIPVIDVIRKKLFKKVEYVGFSAPQIGCMEPVKPTNSMIHRSDTQRVLPVDELKEYIIPSNKKKKFPYKIAV
jgi:uncharacterized LabA/DUF88 family protein